jgi:hypothetical protein
MKLGCALIGKRDKEEGEGGDFDGVGGMEGRGGAEAITQCSTESRIRLVSWRNFHGCFTSVSPQKWPLPRESENSTVPPQTYPTAMITLLSRCFALILLLATTLHAQVPQLINYQGRVVVDGVNFDGAGQFKFALVNASGSTSYWSNDGSSVAGGEPTNAVTLAVSKGLYSVLLGDATLPNMTIVPATVFANGDVHLRVWFNDGVTGFQQLTPDRRIAAVGYAMMADSVVDGAVTTAKIADGAVTAEKLAAGVVQSGNIATSAVGSAQLATDLTLGGITTGTFSGSLTGNVTGNVSGSAASFLGTLMGEVTGTQGATVITDGAITPSKIAEGAVTGAKISDGSVGSSKIAAGAIIQGKIADSSVGSGQLAGGAALANIAPLSITSSRLANGSVTAEKISDGAIGSNQLAPGSVGSLQFAPGAVLGSINPGSIQTNMLADSSVTSVKIVSGAVDNTKMAGGCCGWKLACRWIVSYSFWRHCSVSYPYELVIRECWIRRYWSTDQRRLRKRI